MAEETHIHIHIYVITFGEPKTNYKFIFGVFRTQKWTKSLYDLLKLNINCLGQEFGIKLHCNFSTSFLYQENWKIKKYERKICAKPTLNWR